MAKIVEIKIKKIFFFILVILVSLLVLFAFYSNRDKFSGPRTIKYIKISLDNAASIDELAEKYSDQDSKERFVSEIKRMNNIENTGFISCRTLIIPVLESN